VTQPWSPIGGITSYGGGEKSTFDDPTLPEIARRHGKVGGSGDAALAPAVGPLRNPEVDKPARIRRELRCLRLRARDPQDRRARIPAGLSLHEQAERFRDEPVQTTEHLPARASKEHAKPGNLRSKIAAE
jgi:hypothetical protein